jgi:hypothetical protein
MDWEKFLELVEQMRAAQKTYFKDRTNRTNLAEAKKLEKQVDQAIAEYQQGSSAGEAVQLSLIEKIGGG